jgi:hypothetical protein
VLELPARIFGNFSHSIQIDPLPSAAVVPQPAQRRRIMVPSWNLGSPMNLFKSFTLQWWQAGLFKVGLLALGIAVGAYWHGLFTGFLPALIILAAICLAYVTYVWWKQ